MEYRFLGRTGLRLSALSMGTMSFGGDADEPTSRRMFDRCREVGINTFDCADAYGAGRAETILGRFIADCRDDVVITTKAYFPTGPGPNARGRSRGFYENCLFLTLFCSLYQEAAVHQDFV